MFYLSYYYLSKYNINYIKTKEKKFYTPKNLLLVDYLHLYTLHSEFITI